MTSTVTEHATTRRDPVPVPEAAVAEPGFWDGVARSYIPPETLSIDPSLRLHRATGEEVDPLTYEVVRYALLNVNFEHSAYLKKLCISPVVVNACDYQASVMTEHGDLVFLGPMIQTFSNSQSIIVKWILENRSSNPGIYDGDMFLCNDPWIGSSHQPDTTLVMPVFHGDELFCWVGNVLHHADVGGTVPGSYCYTAPDTWSEPPSFPAYKIMENFRVRQDMEDVFLRQSRVPDIVRMDLRAAVAANLAAARKIADLVERYGAGCVKAVMGRTLDASENLFTERLTRIPDGSWSHRAYTEVALPGDTGVYAYQVNIHKRGDEIHVDNEGSEAQTGAICATFSTFQGAVLSALTTSLASDLGGAFGGTYRRVRFHMVPGTLNCADHPAAVSTSGSFTLEINTYCAIMAVAKMMSCGDPELRELIIGPNIPHFYTYVVDGFTEKQSYFVSPNADGMMGSFGGTVAKDGIDAGGHFWIPQCIAPNVEDVEQQFPMLYLYRRFLPAGADGAGRHRGGLGFVEASLPWEPGTVQSIGMHSNESFPKAQGLFGGNPGTRAWFRLRRDTDVRQQFAAGTIPTELDGLAGTDESLGFHEHPVTIGRDDVWEYCSPTTAGYGDPLTRDPGAVVIDVAEALLSAPAAREIYGVVILDGQVDQPATAELRQRLRNARLGRDAGDVPAGDVPAAAEARGPARDQRPIAHSFVYSPSEATFGCAACGYELGSTDANYKDQCRTVERPIREIGAEFAGTEETISAKMVFRDYFCPGCGLRLDTEISRIGDPALRDITLLPVSSD
ncbi:MAG TPA: hydantoinase B/oxoprolinase family protein [Pseudonocardia sp.]|nr:hydantoinase B/oxoprolinase family protein [Pseudonocardia sp.]